MGVLRAEERRRDDERDDDVTVLSLSKVSHKISFENRPKPPPTKKGEEKNKGRTDANNAAVVAAVTAALESFSDKLDAWTVLLTELCRKEKKERLVSARRRGLFADVISRPQTKQEDKILMMRRRKEAHWTKKGES